MARKLSVFDADKILTNIEGTLGTKLDNEYAEIVLRVIGWAAYNNMPYEVFDTIIEIED